MPQIFGRQANTVARFVLFAVVALPLSAASLAVALTRSAYVTNQNVTIPQPVPFSHQHHVGGLGLDCRNCHTSADKARFAGLPPTETCMTCHSQLWTNAAMLAPVRESLAQNKPLHWTRVNTLPDYVYFDHSIHIAKGVGCTTCHGPVETMPLMRQAAPLTMGWCLDCHRNPAPNLRDRKDVYATGWVPPKDQLEKGRKRLVQYHIETEHLTDCSRCHR